MAKPRPRPALAGRAGPLRAAEQVAPYVSGFVVDASVVFKWYEVEADRDRALSLRDGLAAGRLALHAPDLLLLELGNAFRFKRGMTSEVAIRRLGGFIDLGVTLHRADSGRIAQALGSAWKHSLTLYDALYVAVAEHVGLPLVTADERMLRSLQGHPLVLPLASLPGEAEAKSE